MKTSIISFVLLLIVVSCKKDDKLSVLTELKSKDGINFKQSLLKWNELKSKNGNSYSYTTAFGSWTGYGNTTELKVEDGIITSRIYEGFKMNGHDGTKEIIESYSEAGDSLGTHPKGALLLTIDDLYELCAKNYLMADTKNNTLYFETGKDGLMTMCGYVPNGCMDDCFQGVNISSVEWPH